MNPGIKYTPVILSVSLVILSEVEGSSPLRSIAVIFPSSIVNVPGNIFLLSTSTILPDI
jgi:hypothetical protein